jgi:hypothetical protein
MDQGYGYTHKNSLPSPLLKPIQTHARSTDYLHLPQNVISDKHIVSKEMKQKRGTILPNTIEWFLKKLSISQLLDSSTAEGIPQLAGSGLPCVISGGIAAR